MKIVIVGNGFDLVHNLKISFLDFKNFLEIHPYNEARRFYKYFKNYLEKEIMKM